jgi:hypothetical protein
MAMTPYPAFDATVPGMLDALRTAGVSWETLNGTFNVSNLAAAQTAVAAVNPLSVAKARQLAAIAAKKWAIMQAGVTVTISVSIPVPLSTAPTDLTMLAALAQSASNAVLGLGWSCDFKDRAGTWRTLSASQVAALFSGIMVFIEACYSREKVLSVQINAATTWQAVMAIDVSTGWPATS